MNYPTFLKEVDALSARCDADSLRAFVHELARTVQEDQREHFLSSLRGFCGVTEQARLTTSKADCLKNKVDDILAALGKIETGERELESEYNGSWNDWDDEEENEYEFSDSDELLDDIERAFALMHECLDKEEYSKGLELARELSLLRIRVSGDYDDTLDVNDLLYYDLLHIDLKQCIIEAVYLACMASEDRAEKMLAILDGFGDYSVSLDNILRIGSKEIDLEKLLPEWIEALAMRPAMDTDKLLLEAQDMLQSDERALEYASRYAESHPALYLNLLKTERPDGATLVTTGLRAMREVPVDCPTRSSIALLTARHAFEAGDDQTGEMCWLEAFRSSPSVANYLRLRILGKNWDSNRKVVRRIYDSYYSKRPAWEEDAVAPLLFFDERFEEMQSRFMATQERIGWSSTFMKEGIALFLMLLHQGKIEGPGMKAMLSKSIEGCSFDRAEYCMGINMEEAKDAEALFEYCFQRWKEGVEISGSVCEKWIERIEHWVALRVSAIMEANRRKYYWECAAYVAALGETLESRGEPNAKESIMQRYRQEYFRRRAFHEELRRYGMR